MEAWALVVLGCVVNRTGDGRGELRLADGQGAREPILGPGAARRRTQAAAEAWHRAVLAGSAPSLVIASGGRAWQGWVEADAMAEALVALGVPERAVLRERLSHTTHENAQYVAAQCGLRGIERVAIATCVWHLPRAVRLFQAEGLDVIAQVPAGEMPAGWRGAWTRARERLLLQATIAVTERTGRTARR
jgi:uncharacterized SAM-binding protein YcdF (DUF218 family)